MGIKLESVARYLQSKNINFREHEGRLLIVDIEVETSAGKVQAKMLLSTPLDGRVFSIEAANFLPAEVMGKLTQSREFMHALLNLGWKTPFGACELNAEADDLRFVVEVPLEDANLTEAQFNTLIGGLQMGTKEICEMALKVLGKGGASGEASLLDKVKMATDILLSDNASDENKKQALDFLMALANDENAPTQERMAAVKVLKAIKEAMEKAEAQASGSKNPFLS